MIATNPCILLVEDEPDDIFLVQRAFSKAAMSCRIETCTDGEQAIAYLSGSGEFADRKRFPFPELMLLDLKLPRKSGLEVLSWLRLQPGKCRRLPVVLLTSSRQLGDVNRAYEIGANSYLVKPVGFENLVALVRNLNSYWLVMNEKPEL